MSLALPALFSLEGRVALVTGGNSGLGKAIALALAEAGANVVLLARDRARLEEVAGDIEAIGRAAAWFDCDLADRGALNDAAVRAAKPFGAPDILVNAAGVNRRPPLSQLTPDDWDVTLRLNLDTPHFLAQALVPAMIARGWGRIINLASLQSIRSFNNSGAYGVSKAGLAQLTRVQAEAWSGQGINSNAIAPGFFRTPLTRAVFDDPQRAAALAARTMIGRNGELDDVRGLAVFLASRASDYITGQVIFLDGGFSAG
jgi:NAD(P)-dependent dehydrogenase (short-subunit alcohol dehydrogenase family)